MKTVDEMYKESFFARRHKLMWRVPYVCEAVCKIFDPSSLIDAGCGIGDYVYGFIMNGVNAFGVEGSKNCIPYLMAPEDKIFIKDIRDIIDVGWYDMAICLEVLEHIEEDFAETVVYNLSCMSDRILTSAAPPGQKGHYHVNCQEKGYWVEKFAKYNYKRDEEIEERIKKEWGSVKHKKEMRAYYSNLMYFERYSINK
jgi:hypothetical protein